MHDTRQSKLRRFLDRMMAATRVLPAAGFGQAPAPPTDPIQRDDRVDELPRVDEMRDQQHVDASSTAVDKRPRI